MGDSDRRKGINKMVATGLRSKLVFGSRPGLSWFVFTLEMIGFTLIVIALAQPRYGFLDQETKTEGRNVIIAMDTSRSMLARDLEPDRLTRSKLAAQDLIAALPGERIGLMAFAGSAYMQAPLTLDHQAVRETIDQLDIYSVQQGGTDVGKCIDTAIEAFKENAAKQSALILFTDGDDLEGSALDAAEKAKAEGVLVVTVGVGSPEGSIIPDSDSNISDQFIKDDSGKIVKSRLDVGTLESIANLTNGAFINLNSQTMNAAIVRSLLDRLEASAADTQSKRVPHERYQLPLGVGLILLSLSFISTLFRRASAFAPAAAAFAFICLPAQSEAATQEAVSAYDSGDYQKSAELFVQAIKEQKPSAELHFAAGAAQYKNNDFDAALDAFTEALTSEDAAIREKSHYNIGNTLFRRGKSRLETKPAAEGEKPSAPPVEEVIEEWENAITHYQDALSINAANTSATTNIEVVKKHIEQLKQQQQEEDQKSDESEKSDEEKKEDQEKKDGDEQKKEDEQKGEEGEKKEEQEQKGEENKEGDKGEQKDGEKGEDGEKSDEQKPGQEGEKSDEENKEDGSQPKPGDEKSDEQKQQEAQQQKDGTEGEKGKEGEEKKAQQMTVPEDEKVDPKTGYSKKDAQRLLQMLSDEQLDVRPMRRRGTQGFSRDW
jgi:Ca-activated chloride channel family protein